MSRLYHFELGFPEDFSANFGTIWLEYSDHALRASKGDRFGAISLPALLDTRTAQVVEAECDLLGGVLKVVYRVPHCEHMDLCLAVVPGRGVVKTVWLNRKDDVHSTLDKARYTVPRGRTV